VRLAIPLVWLVCSLFVAMPTARAQGTTAAAEQEFRLGYRALQAGNCVEALVHYRRSLELAQRPRTLFNIATCEEELGQHVAAWRDYQAFLLSAETRDASIVVEARSRIEGLRKRLRGQIAIDSMPSGATVNVDGERQPRGQTPVTLSLEPGRHVVTMSLPGTAAVEREVEIGPEQQTTLHVDLALPSTIAIRTDPSDATIDPESDGATAIGRLDRTVQLGRHAFVIRRDGYRTERIEVDAQPGRIHDIHVNLRPQTDGATLVIVGAADATVVVDGNPAVVPTMRELRSIGAGDHEIEVMQRGHVVWRRGLQFSPGEIVSLDLDLPAPRSTTRRTLGWCLGGFGAGSIVTGGVVGTLGLRDVRSSDFDVHDRGKTRALVADGMFVAGAAALVVAWRLLRTEHVGAEIRRESSP
jgi:hypothetical protein